MFAYSQSPLALILPSTACAISAVGTPSAERQLAISSRKAGESCTCEGPLRETASAPGTCCPEHMAYPEPSVPVAAGSSLGGLTSVVGVCGAGSLPEWQLTNEITPRAGSTRR